jgi:hypothetical protein
MNEYLLSVIRKYRSSGLLVDTNLLLLYLVGSADPTLIRRFSRTSIYSEDDFDRVSKFIEAFDVKVATPHVLTEVSDLFGNRNELNVLLGAYIERVEELFTKGRSLIAEKPFLQFGLADTSVIEASRSTYLILTDDRPLYGFLFSSKIDAVNLDHIRAI